MISRKLTILASLVALAMGAFAMLSITSNGMAFPLDDAWIHQAYARNLAQNAEWAFLPGQPSSGGTSYSWVLLLAIGQFLKLNPVWWSAILNFGIVLAIAILGQRTILAAGKDRKLLIWVVALLLIFEWHILWAAFSGMETLLSGLIALLAFYFMLTVEIRASIELRDSAILGILLGLAAITRPDGITLAGPIVLFVIFQARGKRGMVRHSAAILLPAFLIVLPYALTNIWASGEILPNTFFAKQAEYIVLLQNGFAERWLTMFKPLITGLGALLLPGILALIFLPMRKGSLAIRLMIIWIIGFVTLFALRLPLDFQHGRYVLPILPTFLVIAFLGILQLLEGISRPNFEYVLQRVFLIGGSLITITFFVLGARALRQDVQFINNQMIASADWVTENIAADQVLAAHDIGALGYFSSNHIVDMAGLISPEVISIIRDEGKLAFHLDESNVDYLVAFPDWYPLLGSLGEVVFQAPQYWDGERNVDGMIIMKWGE